MDLFFSNCLPPSLPPVRPPCTSPVPAHTSGPAPLFPSRVPSRAAGARTEGHFPQAGRAGGEGVWPRAPCLQAVAALSDQGAHCCHRLPRPWWHRASAWPATPGLLGSEGSTPLPLCQHPVAMHTLKASTPTTKDEVALHTNLGLPVGCPPAAPPPGPALPPQLAYIQPPFLDRLAPWKPLAGSRAAARLGEDGGLGPACAHSALEVT